MMLIQKTRKMLAVIAISLCMMFTCVPMMDAYAEAPVQTAQEVGTDDETVFMFIMGGGLLVIIFAVAASVTAVTSVSVAAAVEDEEE